MRMWHKLAIVMCYIIYDVEKIVLKSESIVFYHSTHEKRQQINFKINYFKYMPQSVLFGRWR